MKEIWGEMQRMGIGLQGSLKEVKNEMKKEVGTIRAEVNKLKENVKEVLSAVKAGEEDVKEKMVTVAEEMGKVKEGQDQIKGEIEKNTTAIKGLEESQEGPKEGLKAVTEECEKRHR